MLDSGSRHSTALPWYDSPMDWRLLATLTKQERSWVMEATIIHRYPRNALVFAEGDPADSVHLVRSGHLAVQVSTYDGQTATLNVLGPGDHVGELALLPGSEPRRRSASVLALEATQTHALSVQAFRDLCRKHPVVQGLLVDLLADRVRELSGRLVEAMYTGLDRRVYRRLVELTEHYNNGGTPGLVPLTQDQLADLVGGTRQTVNQVLQRLVECHIVELGRGTIVVRDLAELRRRAGSS